MTERSREAGASEPREDRAQQPTHAEAPGAARSTTRTREPASRIGGAPRRFGLLRAASVFGALAVLLCLLLGVAIVTQVRQNESGDSLETARPADLLVLLDSLQQREAALNTEVAELQRTLASLQASGSNDQAAIENAQARLAALSILIGTVSAPPGPASPSPSTTPHPGCRPRRCST